MNTQNDNQKIDDDSDAFESAVWAVVMETVPPDSLQRIKERAKSLQGASIEEDESSSLMTIDLANGVGNRADSPSPAPKSKFAWLRVAGLIALAASLLVIVAVSVLNPTVSLAQVISRTFSRPWVHTTTVQIHDDGTTDDQPLYETWTNVERGIKAFNSSSFVFFEDRGEDRSIRYERGDETATETLPTPPDMIDLDTTQTTLEQLIAIEGKSNRLGLMVSNVNKTESDQSNQMQIDFDLRQPGNPLNDRHFILLVDHETKLAISMTESRAAGKALLTTFDYPDTGPVTAVQAGVPEDIAIDDRRASTDVRQVAGVWSKSRNGFDAYDSVYVQTPKDLRSSVFTGLNADIKRVRQMGDHYRVDALLKPMPGIEPPAEETDMNAWWIENRDSYYSYPMLVCDGTTVTYFEPVEKNLRVGSIESNPAIQQRNVHPIRQHTVWGHLMPEQTCRPSLFLTDDNRRFEYSPTPDDGPADSVRLTSTNMSRSPASRSTYWLDPSKGFAVKETRQPVYDKDQIAFVDTEKFFDFQQSPSKIWYPARGTLDKRFTRERSSQTFLCGLQCRTYG